MASVSIGRFDKLPDVCIRCGEPATRKVRLKFAPKEKVTAVSALFMNSQLRRLRRLIPTIAWSLPFCDAHASSSSLRQLLQIPLIISGFGLLLSAAWSFITTNATWSPIVSSLGGVMLIIYAHHFSIRPIRVTQATLECGNVDERFSQSHMQINQIDLAPGNHECPIGLATPSEAIDGDSFSLDLQ